MTRLAVVFLVAVFLPSVALGILALRTAADQQAILEGQTAELYQNETDTLAAGIGDAILGSQREFAQRVRDLLAKMEPRMLAWGCSKLLGEGGIAFAIDPNGVVVTGESRSMDAEKFISANRSFLSSIAEEAVFPTTQSAFSNTVKGRIEGTAPGTNDGDEEIRNRAAAVGKQVSKMMPPVARKVAPAVAPPDGDAAQSVAPQVSDFQSATSTASDGVLARFSQNRLELILWTRPPEAHGHVFALALPADAVAAFVREAFEALAPPENPATGIAVLDENARPVARKPGDFGADWTRPFVATGIGELLPHWEVALYLREPGRLAESARLVRLTLFLLVGLALSAILAGGAFVAWDARRHMLLAQRKTDFVSNVSHELKTPLTSIRMFAEMLERDDAVDPARRSKYLRIILHESERLTRLINNVLDFARMERNRHSYRKRPIDLHPVLQEVWDTHADHLREAGFTCEWDAAPPPYPVTADADAISQIVVNLLSNAEKYSRDQKAVTLRTFTTDGAIHVEVQDRGISVRPGEGERIFEAFHRSDDSLSSGVRGSGLGLALARRIATDHGGTVTHRDRLGGGSIFTLTLPLDPEGKTELPPA
jgi:Signal transduction histidine kinase